jgi:amino acid adenylation domain-containing protein
MTDINKRIADLSPEKRALLEQRLLQARVGESAAAGIGRRHSSGPCPLYFSQERLWFLDQLEPGLSTYNVASATILRGPLNVQALEKALREIVRRQGSLRTVIALVDGQPMQVVLPDAGLTLPVTSLEHLPLGERETAAADLAREEGRRPFDLTRGPLFRGRLLKLDAEEHVLILNMHHIISDGWSAGVLNRELAALYGAFSTGAHSTLPDLAVQYTDFTLWQRERLQGSFLEGLLSYWRRQLAGLPVLELPTDRPRPAAQTYRGATHTFTISKDVSDALNELSRRESRTLFMTLLALFKTLLFRYSGQSDIVVGSPIANRPRVELEGLVGFFVNSLPLRTDLSGNPTFRELLGRVHKIAMEAYAYQDLPLEKMAETVRQERTLSHSPVFQVMFALQNESGLALTLPGLTVQHLEVDNGTAKFDMILSMMEVPEGIRASLEYNTDLFDKATVLRMAAHFESLAEAAVADPLARIGEMPLLSSQERQEILVDWNRTERPYMRDKCLHELFVEQVTRTPEAIAVSYAGGTLTYSELDRRSNQLARYISRLGVAPDDPVGLSAERSIDMVVAMLAILKAGGAYLPLDPAYPLERTAFLVRDAGAKLLLTQERFVQALPEHGARIVRIDSGWPDISSESDGHVASAATADSIAYVIYTSGSSGIPKGVAVSHRAVNRLVSNTDYLQVEPSDVIAQASNASFDAATFEIWGALLNGAKLVGVSRDEMLSPHRFARKIRDEKITAIFLTTALFNYFAREAPAAFSPLRCLLFGGEAADPACVRKALAEGRPERLLNVYGPTESTTFATWHHVREVPQQATTVPIGKPIANTTIYILDGFLQPVPIGVHGEIYIGGDGLARGYLNRPELTAEKFVPDPFGKSPGRLYRTGDIARFLPDGSVEFVGRADNQVKLRGFRIELGEIEAVLSGHPDVKQCAVLCREDRPGDKRIVAYVASDGSQTLTTRELRSFLQTRLPEYMVPSSFVLLESLPITPNGKVDRRALPAPDESRADLSSGYVAPRTPAEEALTKIWAEALQVERVGIQDNFFELGGHSLLAVRLFGRIEKVFGKKLPLSLLFSAPTIQKLAEAMGEEGRLDMLPPIVPIETRGNRIPFFGVATADALVFADLARRLGPGQPFYGLHPQGIVTHEEPDIAVEDLAARYVAEIERVQPHGPYLIGGTCAGGVVAYEIAQQLHRKGEKVEAVVMFDVPGPFHPLYRLLLMQRNFNRFAQHMTTHARALWNPPSGSRMDYLRTRLDRLIRKLRGQHVPPDRPPVDTSVERVYYMSFNRAYMRTVPRYAPKAYAGKLLMFLAVNSAAWRFSRGRRRWRKYAKGGVEEYIVPGAHSDMLREPQVNVVADHLAQFFSTLEANKTTR